MDPLVSNHIGYLLDMSEVGPKAPDCLLQNTTDGEIDALSSVCLNIVFERLSLTDDDSSTLAKYGPIILLMSDRGKCQPRPARNLFWCQKLNGIN